MIAMRSDQEDRAINRREREDGELGRRVRPWLGELGGILNFGVMYDYNLEYQCCLVRLGTGMEMPFGHGY